MKVEEKQKFHNSREQKKLRDTEPGGLQNRSDSQKLRDIGSPAGLQDIREAVQKTAYPERILQFGTGNFLRGFADWMIEKANRAGVMQSSVVICQPTASARGKALNAQNGLYTVISRGTGKCAGADAGECAGADNSAGAGECVGGGNGADAGEETEAEIITCISRCISPYENYDAWMELAGSRDLEIIISNTTEAGISYHEGDRFGDRPPVSFPAKLCAFLYERFCRLQGAPEAGLLILPCELIERNGQVLQELVYRYAEEWELPGDFLRWTRQHCVFCETLVDRIVPGYPAEEEQELWQRFGYRDRCMVVTEEDYLWVIAVPEDCRPKELRERFPLHKAGLNVQWVRDAAPYRQRKVRILNGAHTGLALAGVLSGIRTVREMMENPVFSERFDRLVYGEIIPAAAGRILPEEELREFADMTKKRFRNPYLRHRLLDISLNSCAKVRARLLPSLLDWYSLPGQNSTPQELCRAFASFMRFYRVRPRKMTMPDGSAADSAAAFGHGSAAESAVALGPGSTARSAATDRPVSAARLIVYEGTDFAGNTYEVKDESAHLAWFSDIWAEAETLPDPGQAAFFVTDRVLANKDLWGMDLTELPGFREAVGKLLQEMV